jgi:hypothetical protein
MQNAAENIKAPMIAPSLSASMAGSRCSRSSGVPIPQISPGIAARARAVRTRGLMPLGASHGSRSTAPQTIYRPKLSCAGRPYQCFRANQAPSDMSPDYVAASRSDRIVGQPLEMPGSSRKWSTNGRRGTCLGSPSRLLVVGQVEGRLLPVHRIGDAAIGNWVTLSVDADPGSAGQDGRVR